jgi:uncharacterized protein GlcG (DUF336 family)
MGGSSWMRQQQSEGSLMSSKLTIIAGLALAAALGPCARGQGVLVQHDVSVRMGMAIADAALTSCEKKGASVSVAVVDRAGRLRVFLQGDKASPHNIELARRKAYTALTFGISSAEWAKRTVGESELAGQRQLGDVIALRGGIPIKLGTEKIGAVGVSGSNSEGDEACAQAGLDAVADQLK